MIRVVTVDNIPLARFVVVKALDMPGLQMNGAGNLIAREHEAGSEDGIEILAGVRRTAKRKDQSNDPRRRAEGADFGVRRQSEAATPLWLRAERATEPLLCPRGFAGCEGSGPYGATKISAHGWEQAILVTAGLQMTKYPMTKEARMTN